MRLQRLLFASIHGYLDPSNGASTASRDLLELLAARGVDCRVLSTGVLDYRQETELEAVLAGIDAPATSITAELSTGGEAPVYDLELSGVRLTLLPTSSSRIERSPTPAEAGVFLDLADQAFDRFRPQALLTYGGHPVSLELMARARKRGIAVVFHLHNFAYSDRSAFDFATAVLAPTEYCRRHYARTIGLDATMIPYPFLPARVVADDRKPEYLTFVNPVPEKGVAVFARIAAELGRRRPDIPILVVEGRGTTDWLSRVAIDLSEVTSLHRMANTPDPRDFYRATRALLVPSVWIENGALVAREAMANGIPVLASDRGGLPETLGDSGFVFNLPARCTPESGCVPTADEVAPWIAAIERLWDDPAWETKHSALALAAAEAWSPERLTDRYLEFFGRLAENP
ncbi:MAG: glycosyltransferase [Paludisphaera borealis]|uniref:glycosyltransferase n=1 Tax=Paludisphaera borealis TaxID=1387353 RepID=UPI0028400D19|nr:glycosyltransferase [Paludisphaera borealis]MDR3623059.1 glycosyltransferase [Paludisphaera borealis]